MGSTGSGVFWAARVNPANRRIIIHLAIEYGNSEAVKSITKGPFRPTDFEQNCPFCLKMPKLKPLGF